MSKFYLFCVSYSSASFIFLGPSYEENQLWFWKYSPFFVFSTFIFGATFALFWALRGYLFGPLGLFLGSRSGSKTFFEATNVDYQFLFWKHSPIFFVFLFSKILGLVCTFWALPGYFWGWG